MSKKKNFIRIFSNTLPIRWELSWKEGFSLRSKSSFLQYALQRRICSFVAKKLRKINDCVGGNCLTAALMLFQEAHPSSKLGDVPLKTPCIIFLMMSPPKQSQKIIQSCRRPWRSYRLPWRSCRLPWRNSRLPWSCCPPRSCCLPRECWMGGVTNLSFEYIPFLDHGNSILYKDDHYRS